MNKIWRKVSSLSLSFMLAFTMVAAVPAFAAGDPNPQNVTAPAKAGMKSLKTMSVEGEPGSEPISGNVIIDNGTVQLGIHPQAHLNVSGGTLSMGNETTLVGLRYVPTNGEATAPGCTCEGWGVADANTGVTGSANDAVGGIVNLNVLPETGITAISGKTLPESVGSAFKSVVTTGEGQFKVTHDYKPSTSPNLYEVEVTIENIGTQAVDDLRYRRVMDWDIPPHTFQEHVVIHVGKAKDVIHATTDGFRSGDPLSSFGPGGIGGPPALLVPGDPDYQSSSYYDQGALFDFGFGKLDVGAKRTFKTFYGAAENRDQALKALTKVGAEVYSFGIPRDEDGNPSFNGPHIFIFAFGSVGGAVVDGIAPTTGITLNPAAPNGANGWYKSTVTASIYAADNVGGTGVDKSYYRINSGVWKEYTAPFDLDVDGNYTIDFYSTDKAGNIEPIKSTALKIDKTAPVTKYSLVPINGLTKSGKSYVKGYTATLTATDNLSTVTGTVYRYNNSTYQPYTGPFTFYANDTLMLDYYSTDGAGNQETPNIFDFVRGIFTGNK
jgi:hypothetical protein